MSYTYTTYLAALAQMMGNVPVSDPNLLEILPSIIESAELRLCRDLDFLSTVAVDQSTALTIGVRSLVLPLTPHFVTVTNASAITPVSMPDNPEFPIRNPPLLQVSKDLLDAVYGNQVPLGLPIWFTMLDGFNILVGPYPDLPYSMEFTGTTRAEALSATNQETFIATYMPDIFLAASMIFASAYQKNFGAQSDNPQMALSWDAQYSKLLAGAQVEEARKKSESSGWSSRMPAPVATPTR